MYPSTRSRCFAEISDPICAPGSDGGPTGSEAAKLPTASTISSYRERGARMRVCATQACPLFMTPENTSIGTEAARSTSSSRMAADLPPSSRVHGLSISAARLPISLPTAELPVNEKMSMSGLDVSACPVSIPPGTIDSTPSGRPASANTSAKAIGTQRCFGGRLEHHRAAGQQRRAQLVDRQEQRHVPRHDRAHHTERLTVDDGLPVAAVADFLPLDLIDGRPGEEARHPIPLIHCIVSMDIGGWPVSSPSSLTKWSLRSSISLSAPAMTAARSFGGVEGQGPLSNAARAAATAASTSAAAANGTLPTYSPVAGQCTSMTSDVDGSIHFPPMKSLSYSVVACSVVTWVMAVTLPKPRRNENTFHYCGWSTSTRLLTRNSRSTGTAVSHQAHFGW